MSFFRIVLKNLLRRRVRSLLTMLGLAIAVASTVALVGVSSRFEQSYYELYEHVSVDLVVQQKGGSQILSRGIREDFRQQLEKLPSVKLVMGGLVDVISLEEFGLFLVVVNGWQPGDKFFEHLTFVEGAPFGPQHSRHVNIGKVLAANTGKKVGDTIDIYAEPLEIVGIFESFNVYENGAIVMPLSEMQAMMDRRNKVTAFLIEAADRSPEGVALAKQQVETLSPNLSVDLMANFVGNVSHIKVSRGMAWMTSAIALIIGAIGMMNTMAMAVHERIKEIGTLRAIGWQRPRIVRMIVGEATILSLFGGCLGCLLAIAILRFLTRFPITSGFIDGYIAPQYLALGVLMGFVVGVAGAAYPAWWGASLSPVEALRKK
jgi:putative ABC transport system permease protein